jgi:hypothetical protein
MSKFKKITREKYEKWWKPESFFQGQSTIATQVSNKCPKKFYLIIWWNIISPYFCRKKQKKLCKKSHYVTGSESREPAREVAYICCLSFTHYYFNCRNEI